MAYQNFAAQPAPGSYVNAQSVPPSYLPSNGFYPPQGYHKGQQNVQNLQPMPHNPHGIAVVGSQYCARYPTIFFVKDKLLSWSGGDVAIFDGQGGVAFTVEGKAMSIRGSRVLKDAAGSPVCALKSKLVSLKNKWMVYRGPRADDSLVVASVDRELFTLHQGVQAKLPGSDAVEYSARAKGVIRGNREIDILHRGQSIGHVTRVMSGAATFLDKQSYRVDLSPGYDHAFLLCMVIIMDEYFHSDVDAGLSSAFAFQSA